MELRCPDDSWTVRRRRSIGTVNNEWAHVSDISGLTTRNTYLLLNAVPYVIGLVFVVVKELVERDVQRELKSFRSGFQ